MLTPRSLPSRGAWIEIGLGLSALHLLDGRSPHGERGLKSDGLDPCRGAVRRSLPSRGAWIEIEVAVTMNTIKPSLPSRGAWIEI